MRRFSASALGATLAVLPLFAGISDASAAGPAPVPLGGSHRYVRACAAPAPRAASCHAIRAETLDSSGKVVAEAATTAPSGYGPAQLQSAYKLPSATAGAGQTVAIVDAYDDPRAEADLGVYRSRFGLPPCTTANGCFRKVNQSGGTKYPRGDVGWAQEISLDLDMVSATCPKCHILLVEASSSSLTNLGTAVNQAAKMGATEISNSYGASEFASETNYDSVYYRHPGIPITVSSGDSGYHVQYPAASPYVTAVGGTRLVRSSTTRGWTESAWSTNSTEGAGSGCSAYEPQPTWQTAVSTIRSLCSRRAVADVSAVADPATGVAVYDSYGTSSSWLVFGGTSVSAPIIASVYALAGNGRNVTYGSYPYAHTGALFDVKSGATAPCGTALCKAVAGWDGPTGLGTPHGTGGF